MEPPSIQGWQTGSFCTMRDLKEWLKQYFLAGFSLENNQSPDAGSLTTNPDFTHIPPEAGT